MNWKNLVFVLLVAFMPMLPLHVNAQEYGLVGWGADSDVPAGLLDVVDFACGGSHRLALRSDGTVVAWENNDYGQCDVPSGLGNVISISAGDYHSLALRSDGTVAAWGANYAGQCDVPSGLSNVVSISAGGSHSLALRLDGTVAAWGNNDYGQCDVPSGLSNVVSISAGGSHSLALRSDGTVAAWGQNTWYGQCDVPDGLSDVVSISAGGSHSLALRLNGAVVAWGANYAGQCAVPAGLADVAAIAAGGWHNVAVQTNGTVFAWGETWAGQCSVPEWVTNAFAVFARNNSSYAFVDVAAPVIDAEPVDMAVHAGQRAVLALETAGMLTYPVEWFRDGTSIGTGYQLTFLDIQLTDGGTYYAVVSSPVGSVTSRVATVTVEPAPAVGRIYQLTGPSFAGNRLVLTAAGYGAAPLHYSWQKDGAQVAATRKLDIASLNANHYGDYKLVVTNAYGIAQSETFTVAPPESGVVEGWGASGHGRTKAPFGLTGVAQVSGGMNHNLALTTDGTVTAWGYNAGGQCDVPVGLTNVSAVVAYGYNSLGVSFAVKTDGNVLGWGQSYEVDGYWGWDWDVNIQDDGEIWHEYTNGVDLVSAMPSDLSDVVSVSVGLWHALALKADGTVVAWGDNGNGQCNVPDGLSDVVAVEAGDWHNVALRADGTVVAWGANWNGQCNLPEDLVDVSAIAAGGERCLMLKADGTVTMTGSNWYGDVPDGLSDAIAIASGDYHGMALRRDDAIVTWGANWYGQCDVPDGISGVLGLAAGGQHSLAIVRDSDGDGVADYVELDIGRDPYHPADGGGLSMLAGTIRGEGAPLENATIELRGWSGKVYHRAQTAWDGTYLIEEIIPGAYLVKVMAPGYVAEWYAGADHVDDATPYGVRATASVTGFDFNLAKGQGPALVFVTSDPSGADIYVDMQPTGMQTPALLDIGEIGQTDVLGNALAPRWMNIKKDDLPLVIPQRVYAVEGETVEMHLDYSRYQADRDSGTLVIRSDPAGAEVYVDYADESLGVTPLTVNHLTSSDYDYDYLQPGASSHAVMLVHSHKILLKKDGYLRPRMVEAWVGSGETVTVDIPLAPDANPDQLTVSVASVIPEMSVYVDYLPIGEVTDVMVSGLDPASHSASMDWQSASHTIMLRKAGQRWTAPRYIPHQVETGYTLTIEPNYYSTNLLTEAYTTNKAIAPVPHAWLDRYQLVTNGNYEAAATNRAANGRMVWENYVIGIDPTDPDAEFTIMIEFKDGKPVLDWDPDTSGRRYTVVGKEDLLQKEWVATNANTRFFGVKVYLPRP